MEIKKRKTDTYILTNLDDLDPVTVYVTNYETGKGKLVIESFGEAWANYWVAMGERTLQEFVMKASNDYLLRKLCRQTKQTDFNKINELAKKSGFDICVTSDVEVAMQAGDMAKCFGDDWYMDLPQCETQEYKHLHSILNAIKDAFSKENNSTLTAARQEAGNE